jgi:hypothetical protein
MNRAVLDRFVIGLCKKRKKKKKKNLTHRTVGSLHLHALWHLLAGAGTYAFIQGSALARARVRRVKCTPWVAAGCLPVVSPGAAVDD